MTRNQTAVNGACRTSFRYTGGGRHDFFPVAAAACLLWFGGVAAGPTRAPDQNIAIVVSPVASSAERIAATELATTLSQIHQSTAFPLTTELPATGNAVLIGTPANSPEIRWRAAAATLRQPEAYFVRHERDGNRELGIIAGTDARGVVYGSCALLKKLGCGFQISRDILPAPQTAPFSFAAWDLADAPLFPHRVVFNWHNFLSGCSSFSPEHWQQWIRQAQKSGYNAVMVHAYGNNPMNCFEFGGQSKPVGYLSTTRSGRDWATMHVNDVRRLWGGQVFDGPVFGSSAAMTTDGQRLQSVRKMMRDAFQCASDRAMGVFFAFDIETYQANPQNVILTLPESARFLVPSNSGSDKLWLADPDTPEGSAYYKAQVAGMLDSYPQITTLVCWFRWGAGTPWMKMKLADMPVAWQAEYRAEIAKTPETARLQLPEGCFALSKAVKAYARALRELGRSDVAMATGTWRFAFYPACDRFMPRDVMFIGLDYEVLHDRSCFTDPQQRAQQALVGSRRPIVPVAWAHHDDGAYLGRPYTPPAGFADALAEMKAAGFGVIHWTTRPLDLYFASLSEQVRESTRNRPLRETCADMAAVNFGELARRTGGEYLHQWVTGAPIFSRETSEHFIDRKLQDPAAVMAGQAERLKLLAAIDRLPLTPDQRARVHYFRGLERFALDVHRNEEALQRATEMLGRGDPAAARGLLASCDPEGTIARFAGFSCNDGITRGEQGTVVSLNTRWLPHYTSLRQALRMEPVRINFGPTQHDPLAQSPGRFTFHFSPRHELWQTLGSVETGAEAFTIDESLDIGACPPDLAEICRTGIETERPLTLHLAPILKHARKSADAMLPAGDYQLTFWTVDPSAGSAGERVFDVSVATGGDGEASGVGSSKVPSQRAPNSAAADSAPSGVHDRIKLPPGSAGRELSFVKRSHRVRLDRPGTIKLTLSPVQGKAVLCGVMLEPLTGK